jgi:hypothetical protein
VAKLEERWVAKLEKRWVAKLEERWVAQLEGWVAKLKPKCMGG